jgi:hypothetical protein
VVLGPGQKKPNRDPDHIKLQRDKSEGWFFDHSNLSRIQYKDFE